MKKNLLFFTAILFTLVFAQDVLAAVANGSFENGTNPGSGFITVNSPNNSTVSDWSVDSGSIDYIGGYWQPQDGSRSIDMNGNSKASISQVMATTVNHTYKVTFYISGNPDNGPAVKDLVVTASGNPAQHYLFDINAKGNTLLNMMWEAEEYQFKATGTSTTLKFASAIEGAYGPALDNIVVTEVDTDEDNDGVYDENDMCGGSVADEPGVELGVNRHIWKGSDDFTTLVPAKKGVKVEAVSDFSMEDTYGCSCTQILDMLKEAGLGEFGGHYKFGCSKSVLEDFILDLNDEELDGRYFIENVEVPANKAANTMTASPLMNGVDYILKAHGTASAGDGITFDARYSFRTGSSTVWTDSVSTYEGYGPTLLDLTFNGTTPWGALDMTHWYDAAVVGDGANAAFKINDVYYPNNTGNLYVAIYAQL